METNKTIIKAIAKKYHLTFCGVHGYYEGNAYNNDRGEPLPTYFSLGATIYKLRYYDGCFNPFLVDITKSFDKKVSEVHSRLSSLTDLNEIDKCGKYLEYLQSV